MYDIKKRRTGMDIKVKDIIAELEKENPEAIFTCCGDNLVFIHVEQDESVVTIDAEDLHDDPGYEDAMDGDINDIPAIKGESGYYISRERYWEMLHKIINELYGYANNEVLREELMNLDFTKDEIDQLAFLNPTMIEMDGTVKQSAEVDLPRAKELITSMLDKMNEKMTDEERTEYVGEFTEDELELFVPKEEKKPKGKCPIFFENQETEVKMELQMTVESKEKPEDLMALGYHIERILDLVVSHPEIKSVNVFMM